jgi:fatty acid desaturase
MLTQCADARFAGRSAPFQRFAVGPDSAARMVAFQVELDALGQACRARLGDSDARYIKAVLWAVRLTESAGRGLLVLGGVVWPIWLLGAALLGLSKILENMELGHNVMHGQFNWMNDPRFDSLTYDWDSASSSEEWRHLHNFVHHQYANVLELDRDYGYRFLRVSGDVPWEPRHLVQCVTALLSALLFEWGLAAFGLEMEMLRTDRAGTQAHIRRLWPGLRAKMLRQLRKDYLWWPLAGAVVGAVVVALPNGASLAAMTDAAFVTSLAVLVGNLLAGVIRNVWAFAIVLCGHLTDDVHSFVEADLAHESKGQWYVRQILGSSNLQGGRVLHLLCGNLSHQIEHHLYPDLPSRRYAEIAPQVRDICARYGVPYNTGPLGRKLGQLIWRAVRHSVPGGRATLSRRQQAVHPDEPTLAENPR